jgi:hypothetical protein
MRARAVAQGLVLTLAVVGAACSSDGSPRSTEAFCARLADLREGNPITDALTDDQAADEVITILDDLIDIAPQQLKGDLRTFRGLVDDIREIDPTDVASAEETVRKLATADVVSAARSLADYARDRCGFEDVFETVGDPAT